jgi:hypothetical protein
VQAIFISYRRDDSLPWAGRLHEHLSRHFGEENVFIDIDAIDPGEDFSDVVRKKVEECAVFVPIIGKNWLACTDRAGHRRLDDPGGPLARRNCYSASPTEADCSGIRRGRDNARQA